MFTVVREVEKEVIFSDALPQPPSITTPVVNPPVIGQMQVDMDPRPLSEGDDAAGVIGTAPIVDPSAPSRVFKIVKKLDVQILCTQHNPVCFSFLLRCLYFFY